MKVQFFRVFTDTNDNYGDLASIVIDEGKRIDDTHRQELARKLNTGETIFINDLKTADISVMHPQGEIDFAGVGVTAAAWFLSKVQGKPIETLEGRKGTITTRQDGELTWVRAGLDAMPKWNFRQLQTPEEVEELTVEQMKDTKHIMVWTWVDKTKGIIRARTFANDWDIPEAQGNGSGAMLLATKLNREIQIMHGEGSIIYAKPASDNQADIGGRVVKEPIHQRGEHNEN